MCCVCVCACVHVVVVGVLYPLFRCLLSRSCPPRSCSLAVPMDFRMEWHTRQTLLLCTGDK
jgi:hypothetical protein